MSNENRAAYFADGTIREFRGKYRLFSNFERLPYTGPDGIWYPGVEWGFQAGKTLDHELRRDIAALPTAQDAKNAGRSRRAVPPRAGTSGKLRVLRLREDWNDGIDINIMSTHKLAQLDQHPDYWALLLETFPHAIFEGNTHGDRIWGVDRRTGIGSNRLGRIYMRLRELKMLGPVSIPYRGG